MGRVNKKMRYASNVPKEYPSDWGNKELGEVCDKFLNGGTPSTQIGSYWKGTIPWITGADIIDQKIPKARKFISKQAIESSSTNIIPKGNLVLVTRTGVGKVAISPFDLAISQDLTGLFLNKKELNTQFAYYFFESNENRLRQLIQGTSINGITRDVLSSFRIPIPSLKEQKAIASLMDYWNQSIEKTKKLIENKEKQQKWLIQNLLSGKVRVKGHSSKWAECKIGELFQPIYRYVEWNEESSYKLASIRRRLGGLFFRSDMLGEQIGVKRLKDIHTGDFLISKRQVSHGAWTVVPKEFHKFKVSDEYDSLVIKDKKKITSAFWFWFCQLPRVVHYAYLDSTGVHIEKLIFNFELFKKRKVIIPSSLDEQIAIANILEISDQELRLLRKKAKSLIKQKTGLSQVLFTGKKRLKY